MLSVSELQAHVYLKRKIQEEIKYNKSDIHILPYNHFMVFQEACNPQQRQIEEYVRRQLCLFRQPDLDFGDFYELYDTVKKSFEFKCSMLTSINRSMNLVQLRDWQEVDYYFAAIDALEAYKLYFFHLTHAQMNNEIKIMKFSSAHGTPKALEGNTTKELRRSILMKPGHPVRERWKQYERLDIAEKIMSGK
jgi:hypothetical protein